MFAPTSCRVATLLAVCLFLSRPVVGEVRTWVDISGQHRVEAELVGVEGDNVTLRNTAGKQITLPIARLSQADQAFIRQQAPPAASKQAAPPGGKPATAKPVAKRFYTALIDQNFDEIKSLLTPSGQANWDAAKALLEGLDPPDNRQAVLIRTASATTDGMADVNVSVKVRGKFQKQRLQLRWSDGQWQVAALIPDGEDAEPIRFEGGAGDERLARGGRDSDDSRESEDAAEDEDLSQDDDAEAADAEDDETQAAEDDEEDDEQDVVFEVPDGDAEQLLAYIEQLKTTRPPASASRQELVEFQVKLFQAVLEAAEKVLEADPTKPQAESAVQAKVQVLSLLTRVSRDPELAKKLQDFPAELKRLGFDDLASRAQTMAFGMALSSVGSASEAKELIGQVRDHLRGIGQVGREEINLARSVGSLAERVDDQLAVDVYNEMATLLERDPSTKPFAEVMRGTARRLGLVGNPMELAGVTVLDQPFDLADLKGKVVLVDFWATWCGPCLQEMPNIRKNYEKYHEQGFEVVAVSVDQDLKALEKFLEQEAPPWLVLVDEHPQNARKMGAYYGVNAIPTTILVGADGKVITFNCRGERLGTELARLFDADAS